MVSYKPLWILLVNKNMSKADLRKKADISPNTFTRMSKGQEVSLAVLDKICATLEVSYGDIIEYVPIEGNK